MPAADELHAPWQLCLPGRVHATGLWGEVYRWPLRSVAGLLARLALPPGRNFGREELVDLLWPGVALDRGRARLRQTLSALRSMLEPAGVVPGSVIVANRLTVHVNPSAIVCDVQVFERHVASGQCLAAQTLYRGEFMPGHNDEWVIDERQRLQALFDRVEAACAEATAGLMKRPTAAPAQPDPTANPAVAKPADATPESAALPVYWTRAFGQTPKILQLQQVLAAHRLVTVLAPGRQGKTRLVAAALRPWLDAPYQGKCTAEPPLERMRFVPLSECSSEAALWAALAQAIGIKGAGSIAQAVQHHLQLRRTLLVLDNVEQRDHQAVQALARLLQSVVELRLLLTSRRLLGLDGETIFELPGLELPSVQTGGGRSNAHPADEPVLQDPEKSDAGAHQVTGVPVTTTAGYAWPPTPVAPPASAIDRMLTQARAAPAVALFVDRASQARADFRLDADNRVDVLGLVRYLQGMPLAIALAASRVRVLQPRELLQRLQDEAEPPLLNLLVRPGADAQPSVRTRPASGGMELAAAAARRGTDVAGADRFQPACQRRGSGASAGWDAHRRPCSQRMHARPD